MVRVVPTNPKPRKQRLGRIAVAVALLALAVGVPLGCSVAQQAAWDANSGIHEVGVSGDLSGDGYEIGGRASVQTWAEHKEMVVRLSVRRGEDDNRTPLLAVVIGEDGNRCETARSWIWSTSEGATLDLMCLWGYDLEDLRAVDSVTLVPYSD